MQSDKKAAQWGKKKKQEAGLKTESPPWVKHIIFKLNPIRLPLTHLTVQSGALPSSRIHPSDRSSDKRGAAESRLQLCATCSC